MFSDEDIRGIEKRTYLLPRPLSPLQFLLFEWLQADDLSVWIRNDDNRRPGGISSGGTVDVPMLSFLVRSPTGDGLTSSGVVSLSLPVHACCTEGIETDEVVPPREI